MSYSYSIAKGFYISVCPADGISLDFLTSDDKLLFTSDLTKEEALRLASAIIHAYKTGYVMQDDGGSIEPLTQEQAIDLVNNRLDPYDYE
jgi:hypothetical protein